MAKRFVCVCVCGGGGGGGLFLDETGKEWSKTFTAVY